MPDALTFTSSSKRIPIFNCINGTESPQQKMQSVVSMLSAQCGADVVVLLARENDVWRVMAAVGPSLSNLQVGSAFSVTRNPSLSPEWTPDRPPVPALPDPFLTALGPAATGETLNVPVVADDTVVGLLHLFSGDSEPFTTPQAEMAAFSAEIVAPLILPTAAHLVKTGPTPPPERATAPETGTGTPDGTDITPALALSLLNHDLRSPINAILGFSDLIATGECSREDIARYADMIGRGGEQLIGMVDELVTGMRMSLGLYPWQPSRITVTEALAPLVANGGLTKKAVNTLSGEAIWDSTRVCDAITALRQHAEHTTGTDTVTVTDTGDGIRITVGDPAEDPPADPGFRNARVQFARQVIISHGGTLHGDPAGSRFQVTLSRAPGQWADLA